MSRIDPVYTRPQVDALVEGRGRRRMYDVRDYVGSDDIGAAINRAIAAAGADAYTYGKPGQVILHPFNLAQTTEIAWLQAGTSYHGVDLIGSGWGKTVLRPQGRMAAIHHISPSGAQALRDLTIANFEIDGSEQTDGGLGYATLIKGTYIQRLRRVTIDHLYIHDTGATGLGNDYHDDCTIRDVIADGCGRLNSGAGAGGAGIGIGTGVWSIEALSISDCRTNNNVRAGLFFESQSGVLVQGVRVRDHLSAYNGDHGVGDAGCYGLQVTGGTLRNNALSGFATYQVTVTEATPGIAGRVTGVEAIDNTLSGIHIDWSGRKPGAAFDAFDPVTGGAVSLTPSELGYTIENNTVRGNERHGILIQPGNSAGSGDLPDITVRDNRAVGNARAGIALSGTNGPTGGSLKRVRVSRNSCRNNGSSGSTPYGILINANLVDAHIADNVMWDDQGSPTQTVGLDFPSGITISGKSVIEGNDGRGCATAHIISGTVTSPAIIRNNPGHNPGTTTTSVTVGASPFTYTAGQSPEAVYIDGGTVSAIKRNGLNVFTSTNKFVPLQPYESVEITYSSTPTVRTTRQ